MVSNACFNLVSDFPESRLSWRSGTLSRETGPSEGDDHSMRRREIYTEYLVRWSNPKIACTPLPRK